MRSKIRTIDEHYTVAQQFYRDGFFEESINEFESCLDINFMHLPTLIALVEVIDVYSLSGGDPGRITAQIVTGIGFIGAGVIMKDGFTVRGLNTAASIWCSAAVGTLAGMWNQIEKMLFSRWK